MAQCVATERAHAFAAPEDNLKSEDQAVTVVAKRKNRGDESVDLYVAGEHIDIVYVRRSQVLLSLCETEGEATLPISESNLKLWMYFPHIQQCGIPFFVELLKVASFLVDATCCTSCIQHIASELRKSLRSNLVEQENPPPRLYLINSPPSLADAIAPLRALPECDLMGVLQLLHPFEVMHLPPPLFRLAISHYHSPESVLHLSYEREIPDGMGNSVGAQFCQYCSSAAPDASFPAIHILNDWCDSEMRIPGRPEHLVSLTIGDENSSYCESFPIELPLAPYTALTCLSIQGLRADLQFPHALRHLCSLRSICFRNLEVTPQCRWEFYSLCQSPPTHGPLLPAALSSVTKATISSPDMRSMDDRGNYALLHALSSARLRHLDIPSSRSWNCADIASFITDRGLLQSLTHLGFLNHHHSSGGSHSPRMLHWAAHGGQSAPHVPDLQSLALTCCRMRHEDFDDLTKLTKLTHLELTHISAAAPVWDSLMTLSSLKSLKLAAYGMGTDFLISDELLRTAGCPAFMAGLTQLHISSMMFDVGLLRVLEHLTALQDFEWDIDLPEEWECFTGSIGAQEIAKFLRCCSGLTRILVPLLNLQADSIVDVPDYGLHNLPLPSGLRDFTLQVAVRKLPCALETLCQVLGSVAASAPGIVSLDVAVVPVGTPLEADKEVALCGEWVPRIGAAIEKLQCLESLRLAGWEMQTEDCVEFAAHLSKLPNLDELEMDVHSEVRQSFLLQISGLPLYNGAEC